MINKIVIYALFSLSMLTQAMNEGPKDVNIALLLATINGKIDEKALSYIDNLFTLGADPNYVSHLFEITPLMRAVRVTCPGLVKLLLQKGAKVNVRDPNNIFVRNFNLIYSKKKVLPIIACITDHMLKVETHNTLYPKQKIDCRKRIYFMKNAEIIRNAVRIDKMLEDHKAYSDILPAKHPFLIMLKDFRVKRAMSYIFDNCHQDLPCAIRDSMW